MRAGAQTRLMVAQNTTPESRPPIDSPCGGSCGSPAWMSYQYDADDCVSIEPSTGAAFRETKRISQLGGRRAFSIPLKSPVAVRTGVSQYHFSR
jgi:hypothetical protein